MKKFTEMTEEEKFEAFKKYISQTKAKTTYRRLLKNSTEYQSLKAQLDSLSKDFREQAYQEYVRKEEPKDE